MIHYNVGQDVYNFLCVPVLYGCLCDTYEQVLLTAQTQLCTLLHGSIQKGEFFARGSTLYIHRGKSFISSVLLHRLNATRSLLILVSF